MGRSYTTRYRVVVDGCQGARCWNKEDGRATETNLRKYIEAHNRSLLPGGSNQHLIGILQPARWARIEANSGCGGTICKVEV